MLTHKKCRISSSGQQEDVRSGTSTRLDSDVDCDHLTELAHTAPAELALLHLLDGYYIKRHTIDPWNTSGGFCDVFTGDHPAFGKVAMKRPRWTDKGCTASQLRSFALEGELWKKLHHPNVLQFIGTILSDSRIWLVSLFAEHGTLCNYIRKYPDTDRHSLVHQFTSGLAYLHTNKVVHGDLKASNLLMSTSHEILIGDFGLSKYKGMTTASSQKGAGSSRWMAPELISANDITKDYSSDVYAYGITVSEIISGELPYSNYSNEFAVRMDVSNKNLRPPRIPLESPQGKSYATLWALAEECWDADPLKRPSMVDVRSRFPPDLMKTVDGVIAGGTTHSHESNHGTGPFELSTAGSSGVPLLRETNSRPQPVDATSLFGKAEYTRLLRLLGKAEYGDVGHLRSDGLCLDGTRVEVLRKLDAWSDDLASSKVLLVKGQAGRGKSTIARSVISRFRTRRGGNASSAIFHFRRNNEALNNLPPRALARQLACSGDHRVREAILKSVQDHEDVADLRLEEQFDILLVQSLKSLGSSAPPILLVFDALDECSDRSLVSALLCLIREHAGSLPSSVKFLLTSRPEDHIIRPFNAPADGVQEDLDTVDVAIIDRDVRSYFMARLSEIQRYFRLDAAWMPPDAVSELVSLSQGLFQWAHAAMEYVRESPRLNLGSLVRPSNRILGLPALYQQILSTAFPLRKDVDDGQDFPALVKHVIGSLVVARRPISPAILQYLWDHHTDRLPFSDPELAIQEGILGRLGSILILPSSPDGPIHFMHASVRDFFVNHDQCEDRRFLINPAEHHLRLADTCFRRMGRNLKRDICEINDPSKMNSEVIELVEKHVPSGLRYCCRSWSMHLLEIKDDGNAGFNDVRTKLDEFCAQQLLHWLEVLSLVGVLSEIFDIIRQARVWLKKLKVPPSVPSTQSASLLGDTGDFCRRFFKLMSTNAQHISLSYLLQFPGDTMLRRIYPVGQQVPRIIRGPPPRRADPCRAIYAGAGIRCVVVSPDGKTVAFGLLDHTIRLWDLDSGELKGKPLVGHTQRVISIAFTPDGNTLASGSGDYTIRLWDVTAGELKGKPLVGHTFWVTSIAFTPDNNTLASGSDDCTIRLWDVVTGELKGKPLMGHTNGVRSVAFTPDGNTLASGSNDNTIRLWDVNTGDLKGEPLVGHTDAVWSIAFTPNGNTLASGAFDKTIRLWDVATGELKGKPLMGHNSRVWSVAFAPDGNTLASGSSDYTIRLWNITTGELKGKPLVGHTGWVTTIAFTPNGNTLASGSFDKTMRLWNVTTGDLKGEPLVGHTSWVTSIAFAPDGNTLASGSDDCTIRLWDVTTGDLKGEPLVGHTHRVRSITFASDGNTLISTSYRATFHWRLGDGASMPIQTLSYEDVEGTEKMRLGPSIRLHGKAFEPHDQGWVFIGEKRCFWLPEDFYMDGTVGKEITLFGTTLVLHHRNIHIFDVSAFL